MRVMLTSDSILLHKDYIINMIAGELPMGHAMFLLSKFEGKGFTRYFPEKIRTELQLSGYIDEASSLTNKGRQYISSIIDTESSLPIDIQLEEDFEKFWKVFPATDKVNHFPGTRSLKDNKKRCKVEFANIISEGYSVSDIIRGLEKQLEEVKMSSISENRLTYMKNSLRWLRDRDFLLWEDRQDNSPKFDVDVI